jgi:hypothetical protein
MKRGCLESIKKRNKDRNKRGFELGWDFFFNLLLIISIIVILVLWVSSQADGRAMKKQILAKEICSMTLEAKLGTTITIQHPKELSFEIKDSGILVKDSPTDLGYFYPCYIKNAEIIIIDDITKIEIK